MGDAASWVGIIIAMGSLVVAIIAMRKSLDAQREANSAQRRVVEIEEGRERQRRLASLQAKLRAELRGVRGADRLYLVNDGEAEARNVQVRLDGKPFAEHCAVIGDSSLPMFVGARAEVSCLLAIYQQCAPPFECEIRWDDDSGTDRSYRTTLTF